MSFGCHEDLFKIIEAGCTLRKRDRLFNSLVVEYNQKIHKVANNYKTLSHNDAYSACLKGMYDAFLEYDYRLGVHFLYFATGYMRSECQKAYRDAKVIHIPHNQLVKLEQINKKNLLEKEDRTEEEESLIASVEDILSVLSCSSLDQPINPGSESPKTISDTFSQETFLNGHDALFQSDLCVTLKKYLAKIPKDERNALIHFNGLFKHPEKDCREVGTILGCSHEGARNKRNRAIAKLKELFLEGEADLVDAYGLVNCEG